MNILLNTLIVHDVQDGIVSLDINKDERIVNDLLNSKVHEYVALLEDDFGLAGISTNFYCNGATISINDKVCRTFTLTISTVEI